MQLETANKCLIRGYATGVFDTLHEGHINFLNNAKKMCDYLIVGVSTDELVRSYKCKEPVVDLQHRIKEIKKLEFVDEVVIQTNLDKSLVHKELQFDIYFHGDDIVNNEMWSEYQKKLEVKGVQIVFLPYTKGISSSDICNNIDDFIYNKHDSYISIVKYIGNKSIVVIPQSMDGLPIRKLEDRAFAFCDVVKVYLSKTIYSVGTECFYGCKYLQYVNLGELKVAGIGAFSCCVSLETVVMSNELECINKQMFFECGKLKDISLKSNIKRVGHEAFKGCKELLDVKNGAIYVGKWLILSEYKMNRVVVEDGTVGIADVAFVNDINLLDVVIPDSVISIGRFAFDGSGIWNSVLQDVVYADEWAVGRVGKSEQIILSEKTKGIADFAFAGDKWLMEVLFNKTISYIGDFAFRSCINLSRIKNYNKKIHLGENAFLECYELEYEFE